MTDLKPFEMLLTRWRKSAAMNSMPPDTSKETYYNVGKNHGLMLAAGDLEELVKALKHARSLEKKAARLRELPL